MNSKPEARESQLRKLTARERTILIVLAVIALAVVAVYFFGPLLAMEFIIWRNSDYGHRNPRWSPAMQSIAVDRLSAPLRICPESQLIGLLAHRSPCVRAAARKELLRLRITAKRDIQYAIENASPRIRLEILKFRLRS